jgi:hypothetical protein
MLGRFHKTTSRYRRADGRVCAVQCYLVGKRAARRLRAQALDCPPGPEDLQRFTFRELKFAKAPARARLVAMEKDQEIGGGLK